MILVSTNAVMSEDGDHTLEKEWGTENPLDGSIIAYILSPLHIQNSNFALR